MNQTIYDAV
ncbi:MAG: geranylgeranyl reductase/geranylgeranyl reductase family, partial [Porphyrobacter sp. HL-46]